MKGTQIHSTIDRKEFCPKDVEKHSGGWGYTQTTTNYLKSPKYTHTFGVTLEGAKLAAVKSSAFKRTKGNQNPQFIYSGNMDIKIGERWSVRGIHIHPLFLQAGVHYHNSLSTSAEKTNVITKFIDHFFSRIQGNNIMDMNMLFFSSP